MVFYVFFWQNPLENRFNTNNYKIRDGRFLNRCQYIATKNITGSENMNIKLGRKVFFLRAIVLVHHRTHIF